MAPLEGMQITPSVRLVKPLGAGGMGAVWIAEHLTLHTRVVVKFISAELAANEDIRARFSREASAAAAVKSPHVVQMFDHGVVDGSPFIVMELLEGEDLRRRIERDRILPLQELDAIVTQACKALGQAHRAGIVHRDIKPDNIFLCSNEDGDVFVKLLDFGIAKTGGLTGGMGATKTGAVMGTPYYMSPEQAIGHKGIDFRTDLWSLGVVLFEAMTGSRAFDGDNIVALAMAISQGPMPVPSSVNRSLPPSIDAWFARACARDVGSRFGSAREMADAFHAAVFGAPATATGPRWSVPMATANALSAAPARTLNTTTSPTSHGPAGEMDRAGLPSPSGRWVVVAAAAAAVVVLTALVAGAAWHFRGAAAHSTAATASASQATTDAPSAPTPPPPPTSPTPAVVEAPSAAPSTSAPPAVAVKTTHPVASSHATTKPTAESAPSTTAPPARPTKPAANCNPPYYFDGAGNKVFKKECLQ